MVGFDFVGVVVITAVVNFVMGFLFGMVSQYGAATKARMHDERETYIHGYEDGFYLGCGDYDPEIFRVEIAEKAYREYKGLKHGPTKH